MQEQLQKLKESVDESGTNCARTHVCNYKYSVKMVITISRRAASVDVSAGRDPTTC